MKRYYFAALLYCLFPITLPAETLSDAEAQRIGALIWQNEGAGKAENLMVWNEKEAFPSFGIGHFIWFPKGVNAPFEESFPAMISWLKQQREVPAWLEGQAPWPDRESFYLELKSPRMRDLHKLLQETTVEQTRFIIQRLERALPTLLKDLEPREQQRIQALYYRVAEQPNGMYALIDYVNFKGEGTSPKERYRGEGWGLLQVLQNMDPTAPDIMGEFVRAADIVLTRRVDNAPRDERRWLPGWRKRLMRYLQFDTVGRTEHGQ